MSSAGQILEPLRQAPVVSALRQRLVAGGVWRCDTVSSAAQPAFAILLRQFFPQRPLLIVSGDLKTQETIQQDLETWLAAGASPAAAASSSAASVPRSARPLFFPAWEVLPHEPRLPHADVVSERLETLVALAALPDRASAAAPAAATAPLINTSVTALLQPTFPPGAIGERTRTLRVGERMDPLDLVEWLEDQGYDPEAKVTQKGEISLRGGILDVYPLTSPWPVRLEFFGDDLDSLRYFDPQTQISREAITSVTLPPAGEIGILRRLLSPELAPTTASAAASLLKPALLLDYLPRETILLLCEPSALAAHADRYAEQVPADSPFFVQWEEFLRAARAREFTIIELHDPALDQPLPPDELPELESDIEVPAAGRARLSPARRGPDGHPTGALGKDAPYQQAHGDGQSQQQRPSSPRPSPPSEGGEGVKSAGHFQPSLDSLSVPAAWPALASLDAYRPLGPRAPEPQIAEAQRREFFAQVHRWLRQDYAVHLFCNNTGERQRFEEIWNDLLPAPAGDATHAPAKTPRPTLHLGSLARGFVCDAARLVIVTDAEIFGRYKVQRPRRLKSPHAAATRSALDIDFAELEEGDFVVHLQHGIGRYAGLKTLPPTTPRGGQPVPADPASGQECLVIEYAPSSPEQTPPKLYVPVTEAHLISKYVGAGKAHPPLNTLGGTRWAKTKATAEHAVRDLAGELLSIQAARDSQTGHPCKADTPWQREFESAFLYEETTDQIRAINEAKADQERPRPMDRLICGDVGFGKTEVAIRAAFKCVMDGRQVAILVPTTILAQQHFNTFRERMADYPIRVELLSRFRTRREQTQVIADCAAGSVDIVIGTHRLVQNDVTFKDLGLVVIDEEQRFGVLHKEKFKRLRHLVDVLTLSATPIPRTLYLALTGARDMSTIQTPPHDRLPVETLVVQYDERLIRDAIQRELNRGGQVYFLHNRVLTIQTMAQKLRTLIPHARLVVGHGQMDSDELEEVMTTFINGEADVLLSTSIIESGLDIPNANTIIIDRADRFGLSELYQLRGRVGRYKHQAYAYLLLPRHAQLLNDVRKRMTAIKQYSTLGSGFKIAMRDLEIRGAGNLLGSEQSGHITAIGFDLYCQLLKQSVGALKGEKVKPRVEVRLQLDFIALHPGEETRAPAKPRASRGQADELEINVPREVATYESYDDDTVAEKNTTPDPIPTGPAYLPLKYILEPQQRIEIYRKLAQATDKTAVTALRTEMLDRFGLLPAPVELLLLVTELKILASERGITALETRDDRLMLTRNRDLITLGNKFPRLTKRDPKARLNEIRKLLLAL